MMDFPDLDALPLELRAAVEAHRSLNVYRMVMHTPGLAPGFLALADGIRHNNALPPNLRELAILRVGWVYDAPYEVFHHERIAREVGLSDTGIAAASTGSSDGLNHNEFAILRFTDSLLTNHGLSDSERTEALTVLNVNQLADLVITVGFYQLVCGFLNTFHISTEGEPTL